MRIPDRIIRIFPSRTNATPTDRYTFVGEPTLFIPPFDEIHISVTFTWDLPRARILAHQWEMIGPVKIGGPALGTRAEEFIPGKYLREGSTITSRGCPNRCWFCPVWKRDGGIRELEIKQGHKIFDDNLLACSEQHIAAVFAMLRQQPYPAEFTGGLEAKRITPSIAEALFELKPRRLYLAYDTEEDKEPLSTAIDTLRRAGFSLHPRSHVVSCYALIAYPKDTMDNAESRLKFICSLGVMPFAMLYRAADGRFDLEWKRFQREWARPQIVATKLPNA